MTGTTRREPPLAGSAAWHESGMRPGKRKLGGTVLRFRYLAAATVLAVLALAGGWRGVCCIDGHQGDVHRELP